MKTVNEMYRPEVVLLVHSYQSLVSKTDLSLSDIMNMSDGDLYKVAYKVEEALLNLTSLRITESDEEKIQKLMEHIKTQRQPIKSPSRFTDSYIPKIEIDYDKVKEIADQIKQEMAEDEEYCVECGSEDLTWTFRNQYHDFWICKNCGHEFRTEKIDDEE